MRWCRSFVSVVPDVEDVLDDDGQRGQRAQGDADVGDHRVGDHVGEQETASGATDADAEVAEGIVEVGVHGLSCSHVRRLNCNGVFVTDCNGWEHIQNRIETSCYQEVYWSDSIVQNA